MRAILAVCVSLVLTGCVSTGSGSVQIPTAPAWQAPTDTREFTGAEVAQRVRAIVPFVVVSFSDDRYTLVSHQWLEQYVSWTWAAANAAGVTYTARTFDCEEYALAFYLIATRKAAQAGARASPLVARIIVELAPLTRHELVAVATDRGIFIVEPQPNAGPFRITPLDQYKPRILSVILGDYNPL